jgi:hypothetical protein
VTRAKNRVMKTVNLVGTGAARISAMVAVAARGQIDSAASTNGAEDGSPSRRSWEFARN